MTLTSDSMSPSILSLLFQSPQPNEPATNSPPFTVNPLPSSSPPSPVAPPSDIIPAPSIQPTDPMVTRVKYGIFKPKIWLHESKTDWALIEPTRVKDALATPQWKASMDSKFDALVRNKTWHLVPPSPSFNVVGNKWIFQCCCLLFLLWP